MKEVKDSIAVLADSETLLGFKLAGITNAFEVTPDADASVMGALQTPGVGILIISQDVIDRAGAKTKRIAEDSAKPVVVVIPGKMTKHAQGSSNLAVLVKRAIGVDIMK